MSLTKTQLQQKFNRTNVKRHDIGEISKTMQQYIQFMDYKIRKEFRSFTLLSLCGGERNNFAIEHNFQKAFSSCSLEQKIDCYSRYVENLYKCSQRIKKKENDVLGELSQQEKIYNNIVIPLKVGKSFGIFQETQIKLNTLYRAKSNGKTQFDIDLKNYLMRKSRRKNHSYVLEVIRNSTPESIRFAFLSEEDEEKYLPIITQCINDASYQNIKTQVEDFDRKKKLNPNEGTLKQFKLKKDPAEQNQNYEHRESFKDMNAARQSRLSRSVIEDIVKSKDEQELDDELTELIDEQNEQLERLQKQKRKSKENINPPFLQINRNIFKIILPNYSLRDLPTLHHYGSVYQSKLCQLYVYQNVRTYSAFKMQFSISLPIQTVCKAIYNVQLYKQWHPIIDQGQIKFKISSENSCILYLKTKAFSQWYRNRDYLLLSHMFKLKNSYYIVEKSIQNANFIPFQSITRGNVEQCVWKIQSQIDHLNPKASPRCRVMMELDVDHGGLLNKNHQKELSLRFLKGFENMEAFYKLPENQKKLHEILGFDWVVSDRQLLEAEQYATIHHSNTLKTVDFDHGSEISENDDQTFYSIEDLSQEQKQQLQQEQKQESQHEIEPDKADNLMMMNSQIIGNKEQEEDIELNEEGLVILPKKYLKKKHIMQPFDAPKNPMEYTFESIALKDHWVIEKSGGLKLVNQKKIDAQNNVIKFIMGTLKKNLFSGKGVTGISLPVQIFNVDSNLQRCCLAMTLGPQFLQVAYKSYDPLERFKKVLAFGLSNSIIYFDVQKPFNPILGQTYQGYIRGCPIYAQQISHHPPISSIYFIGRGYKVTVSLQAKVAIHINSGEGINDGLYHVIFDDGHTILFQTPPAELSGLAMGDRRFNIKAKGQYIDQKNNLFCEMKFESGGGGLWSKKKREYGDQIQGQILKVRPDFIRKFLQAPSQKRPSPSQGDIVQKLGQLSGRWPLQLQIDGKTYYDVVNDIPDKMIDDIYPLNSNSNYREDLLYRKKNDLSRSQIQKQRLEILQRGDRKFRQKFHGKTH